MLHTAISRPKLDLKGDHAPYMEAIGGRSSVFVLHTAISRPDLDFKGAYS